MSIVRGTTPTFILQFPEEVDLTSASNVYVTFCRYDKKVTKDSDDLVVEAHSISVYLSQEETLMLGTGVVEIQANWTFGSGSRAASKIATYEFTKQLLPEVLQ